MPKKNKLFKDEPLWLIKWVFLFLPNQLANGLEPDLHQNFVMVAGFGCLLRWWGHLNQCDPVDARENHRLDGAKTW